MQQGCTLLQLKQFSATYQRSFAFSTVSLFNQRIAPPSPHKNWKGDWLFRRSRLELLDQELLNNRPDLLVFQQLMQRRGSPTESDKSILGYGSLDGHQWSLRKVRSYEDTQEDQYLAFAISPPIKRGHNLQPSPVQELGEDGFAAAVPFILESQRFLVVNIEMPALNHSSSDTWYPLLQHYINANLERYGICQDRLIVAGYFPKKQNSQAFDEFLSSLKLKDSADGYCELATDCETSSQDNDLLRITNPEFTRTYVDRVLVPTSALIYNGKIAFNKSSQESAEFKKYGIDRVWPTRRFGWTTTLRLRTCND